MAYKPNQKEFVSNVIEYINTLLIFYSNDKEKLCCIYKEMNNIIKDYEEMFGNDIHTSLLQKLTEIQIKKNMLIARL